MRQALLNVILNAIDAMPSGGRLGLRVEHDAPNECLRLSVSDTGPGIPDEVRAHMFEPFFTTRAAGTGLGLAVVKRIVEAHGGEVVVASPSGVGTTFTLVVPAAT
jgi:signal transduction histidine kinase